MLGGEKMIDFVILQLEYVLRIILAGILGFLIGLERKNRAKDAGIRTHCVVACATALMMIVSKYGFFDLITGYKHLGADIRLDPSRVASTIVSGIGFLGAGMIYVHKSTVSGLTTAAGIFATAGIGMAIGAGMYVVGICTTLIILLVQWLLHMKSRITTKINLSYFVINDVTEKGYLKKLKTVLSDKNITVYDYEINKSKDGNYTYTLSIDIPESMSAEDVLDMTEYQCYIN